ncbi:MAG: hypothetical protein PUE12_07985 [Oscillospiraceae bacterium]|nr:hypothetical protein [Oscillospiraceae bacterium]
MVSDEIRSTFKLGTQEMEYSEPLKRDVFNIVGFVFQNEKVLVVFPKHYITRDRLNELNHSHEESVEDIKLLYAVIKKYCEKENTSASAKSYLGFLDDKKYESDYPFAAFYEIYEYYQKYGLYREKENLVKKNESEKIHIKIRHFNMIWQKMSGYYLNRHFAGISEDGNSVIFDSSIVKSNILFEDKTFDDIDDSLNHFYIDIDHFAMSNNQIYIFDSKYYSSIGNLNYKQFAYNEILRYYNAYVTEINNVLLLPGNHESRIHFSLSEKYIGPRLIGSKIIEQYLEPSDVMKDYISF